MQRRRDANIGVASSSQSGAPDACGGTTRNVEANKCNHNGHGASPRALRGASVCRRKRREISAKVPARKANGHPSPVIGCNNANGSSGCAVSNACSTDTFPRAPLASVDRHSTAATIGAHDVRPPARLRSSSLVALDVAHQNMSLKRCGHALVGSVCLHLHASSFVTLCALHALSPNGQCKTFDWHRPRSPRISVKKVRGDLKRSPILCKIGIRKML